MADVTKVATPPAGEGTPAAAPGSVAPGLPGPPAPVDPRAVRVRLSATSRLGDEAAIRIAPTPEPLRMTNPTVGRGPLGGSAQLASPDDGSGPDGTVLAQRHPAVDGQPMAVRLAGLGGGRAILHEGEGAAATRTRVVLEPVARAEGGLLRREVLVDGFRFEVDLEAERVAALRERASQGRAASAHSGPLTVKAIIPGKVVTVSINPGDAVTAGQQLLVVEAMKMQNELRAPRDGTIEKVGVGVGDNIEVGDLLVIIS